MYITYNININFILYIIVKYNIYNILMMLFQPELGLSVLDLLGRFADSGQRAPLQKQETERDRRGLARFLSDA